MRDESGDYKRVTAPGELTSTLKKAAYQHELTPHDLQVIFYL